MVLLLILSGIATASGDIQGRVIAQGSLVFRSGGALSGPPLVLFSGDTTNVTSFQAEFSTLKVWERYKVTADAPYVQALEVDNKTKTYTFHDAQMTLAGGSHAGWLGIYPGGGSLVRMDVPPNAELEAVNTRKYGEAVSVGTPPPPRPDDPAFEVDVEGDHLTARTPGSILYAGAGKLVVMGLDVEIRSRENLKEFVTGESSSGKVVGSTTQKWLYLEFDDATIHFSSPMPIDLALRQTDFSWTGTGSVQPLRGDLAIGESQVTPDGSRVDIVGDVVGHAEALALNTLALTLTGDSLASTTAANRVILPIAPSSPWSAAVLLAIALGAGGAATWFVRRRAQGDLDADELLTLAHLAGEGGRHDEALGWIRRARSLAPESGALALEEAFHLGELGLVDEALVAYREAARLLGDGQAEFDAALLGLASGALSPAEVEALLVTALDRNPALLLELEEHPVLRGQVVMGAELAAAMRAARRRIGEP